MVTIKDTVSYFLTWIVLSFGQYALEPHSTKQRVGYPGQKQ